MNSGCVWKCHGTYVDAVQRRRLPGTLETTLHRACRFHDFLASSLGPGLRVNSLGRHEPLATTEQGLLDLLAALTCCAPRTISCHNHQVFILFRARQGREATRSRRVPETAGRLQFSGAREVSLHSARVRQTAGLRPPKSPRGPIYEHPCWRPARHPAAPAGLPLQPKGHQAATEPRQRGRQQVAQHLRCPILARAMNSKLGHGAMVWKSAPDARGA